LPYAPHLQCLAAESEGRDHGIITEFEKQAWFLRASLD